MDVSANRDRPRLLALIDQSDGLRSVMDFNVIYSLADRPCQACAQAGREESKESVALVKIHVANQPKGRLMTLCEEHADARENQR